MKKKTHIYIFQPYPQLGGADRSIIRIINSHDKAKFTLISLTKCNYSKFLNKEINYIKLKSKRSIYSIFELRKKINKAVKNSKNTKNVFISNQHFANLVSIISLKKIEKLKLILIDRNHLIELNNYENFQNYLKNKLILFLIKILYKKADAVVGISKTLARDLSKFISKKVYVIYNSALDDYVSKKTHQKVKLPKKILDKKILLNVGFFENQKDQITILKAIKLLSYEFNNFHMIFVGRGSKYNKLKNYIKINKLKNFVSFFTNINNPTYFYQISNLFILSSKYEGFGNVLVEALKNNCPVITSNCKSGPMEIIANGKFGDYFNVGDYYNLKKIIKRHFNNEKRLYKKTILSKKHLQKFNKYNYEKNFSNLINKI